jgi:hypothetical protein
MTIEQSFFKKIHIQDVIYHYTKAPTAIDYILNENQLKFSLRTNAIDPIERISPDARVVSQYWGDEDVHEEVCNKNRDSAFALTKEVISIAKKYTQISFCRNEDCDFDFLNYFGDDFYGYEEKYGFTKPRMWEQYADNYKGVCLAFSKNKIESKNKNLLNLSGIVEYKSYSELSLKDNDVSLNAINNIGSKEYKRKLNRRLKEQLFWKHKDYIGESEYKICTSDNHLKLDIKDCLVAIFISEYTNQKQKDCLLEDANKYKVPIINIKWKNNSIELIDYRKEAQFIQEYIKHKSKNVY